MILALFWHFSFQASVGVRRNVFPDAVIDLLLTRSAANNGCDVCCIFTSWRMDEFNDWAFDVQVGIVLLFILLYDFFSVIAERSRRSVALPPCTLLRNRRAAMNVNVFCLLVVLVVCVSSSGMGSRIGPARGLASTR